MEPEQPPIVLNPEDRDSYRQKPRRRGLVGLVFRLSGGLIETETAANYTLLIFALLAFLASLIIFLV